jgi:hypothetical protein
LKYLQRDAVIFPLAAGYALRSEPCSLVIGWFNGFIEVQPKAQELRLQMALAGRRFGCYALDSFPKRQDL